MWYAVINRIVINEKEYEESFSYKNSCYKKKMKVQRFSKSRKTLKTFEFYRYLR